jgi:cellulose biosynthesis protein BcsQ
MEYKNYDTNLNNVNDYLNNYGVAVIPNILNENECIQFRNEIWDELKYVSKDRFDINKIDTWNEFYNFDPYQ